MPSPFGTPGFTTADIRIVNSNLSVFPNDFYLDDILTSRRNLFPPLKFTAAKLDGAAVNFPGDYAGKIVMLDVWATWCGPCIAEYPT